MMKSSLSPLTLLAGVFLALGGCALVSLPLLGVPGYELGEAMTLAVGVLGGGVGISIAFAERERRQSSAPSLGRALGLTLLLDAAVLSIPWLVAVLHSLLTSPCNPFAHAAFYPLLTLPSALTGATTGVACGFLCRSRTRAALAYGACVLVSALWTVLPILTGPQIFAFNFFGGYFPGPLYDEALKMRPALLWFELENLILAFTVFAVARRWARPAVLAVLALCTLELSASSTGVRMTAASLSARLGGVRESEHLVLHYPRDKPPLEVERMSRDLEFRYAQVRSFLGSAPRGKIQAYLYASPAQKQALVGAGLTQFSKPWHHSIHLNDAPFPHPTAKHELVHAMAAPLGSGPFQVTTWGGLFPRMGLVEGFAVAGDNPGGELSLHEWAAAMRQQKLAPDLRRLLSPGGFYADAPARAYTEVGSFLRYLTERYGREKLNALYAHGDFPVVYGRPLEGLVSDWEHFVDALPLDAHAANRAFARFREGSLFARPCAREVVTLEDEAQAALGPDPARALRLFQRCAHISPQEPAFQLGQASALGALGNPEAAAQTLSSLATAVSSHPSLSAQVALAQADLAFRRGLKAEAAQTLQRVLDLKPGLDLERNAEVKLAAVADVSAGASLWTYLQPGPEAARTKALLEALQLSPTSPYPHYLQGRRLALTQHPAEAVDELGRALKSPLPDALRREALRLKLQAGFEAGDCSAVRADVTHAPHLGGGFALLAAEWRERCDFEDATFHGALVPSQPFR